MPGLEVMYLAWMRPYSSSAEDSICDVSDEVRTCRLELAADASNGALILLGPGGSLPF